MNAPAGSVRNDRYGRSDQSPTPRGPGIGYSGAARNDQPRQTASPGVTPGRPDMNAPAGSVRNDRYGRSDQSSTPRGPGIGNPGGARADVDRPVLAPNSTGQNGDKKRNDDAEKRRLEEERVRERYGDRKDSDRRDDKRDYRPSSPGDRDNRPGTSSSRDRTPSTKPVVSEPPVFARLRDLMRDHRQPSGYKPPVLKGGYYHYDSKPSNKRYNFGFWLFNDGGPNFCRRSVYFHYGSYPYVQVARLYVTPYLSIQYTSGPVMAGNGYYLSGSRANAYDYAFSDIRNAWIGGRLDLIQRHVYAEQKIAVLLDGNYDYSIDPGDYLRMTSDAIADMRTDSFTWQSIKYRSNGDITGFARHIFWTESGATRTVYVTYTLRSVGSDYAIVEVGSSSSSMI